MTDKKVSVYGYDWDSATSRLQIELTCYRHRLDTGHTSLTHLKNAYALMFPDSIATYSSWTEKIVTGWCSELKKGGGVLSVLGASGCGKSYTCAQLALLEYAADVENTVVLCGSTTIKDLEDRIWKYIRKEYNNLSESIGPEIGTFKKAKPESIVSNGGEGGIYGIALESDNNGERLKGRHPKRLVVIVDEGTAITPNIMQVWENWTAAGKEFILCVLSNFKGFDNLCAHVSEPIGGWSAVDYEKQEVWPTRIGGTCILLDGTRSPVYKDESLQSKLPFLKSKAEIDRIIYGDSTKEGLGMYHTRVMQYIRSIPVFSDDELTVLTRKIADKGYATRRSVWAGWGREKLASLDPAFVTGGDECILRIGMLGYERDGVKVLDMGELISLPLDSKSKTPTEYQILTMVVDECKRRGIEPENYIMDSGGTGRGLGSIFQYEWSSDVNLIMPGGGASEDIVDFEFMKTGKESYDRFVTELWFEFRRFVESSQIRGLDNQALLEFCSRKYVDGVKGKIKLETKPEYKVRLYGSDSVRGSPDRADSATYLLYLAKLKGLTLYDRPRIINDEALYTETYEDKINTEIKRWVASRESLPTLTPVDAPFDISAGDDYDGSWD